MEDARCELILWSILMVHSRFFSFFVGWGFNRVRGGGGGVESRSFDTSSYKEVPRKYGFCFFCRNPEDPIPAIVQVK